jgi:hypothetical protein
MQTIKSRISGLIVMAAVFILFLSYPALAQYENRGDINLNGTPFEIEDIAIFADYFVLGLAVFTIDLEAQIAATDVNMDGMALSVADYIYMLRIIWGEGDPPTPPDDTIAVNFRQFSYESSLRLGVDLDAYEGDQMLLHYNTSGVTSIDVSVYPGFDEVSIQYNHTGHNLLLKASGLHSIQAMYSAVNFMKIDYMGVMPVLEQIGGMGFNGEALDFSVSTSDFIRGDINLNEVDYEIADAVLLTNALIYGESVFVIDIELQLAASDVNLDGIPMTVEDQEFLIAVLTGRIDPDDPLGPTFQEHLIVTENTQSISITSTAEGEVGALYLTYLASNLTDYGVNLSDDLAGMIAAYDLVDDTMRVLVYSLGNEHIPASATDVGTISYTGDQPVLISASSAGYEAEKINLSVINRGDVNGDGEINVADVVAIIRIVFGWDTPEEWQLVAMDANCDGSLDIGEAVYLINYIFKGGPPPMCE